MSAEGYPLGNSPFHHVRTQRPGVEVDKTLVHDRGSVSQIRPQPDSAGICNANPCGNDVIGHLREFVHAAHFELQYQAAVKQAVERWLGAP